MCNPFTLISKLCGGGKKKNTQAKEILDEYNANEDSDHFSDLRRQTELTLE